MKKPYDFRELSDIECGNPDCGKLLKKNVVQRKSGNKLLICWGCWVMKTRHMVLATYKKYRAARAKARREGGDPEAIEITAKA